MSSASIGVQLAGLAILLPLVLSHMPAEQANLWLLFSALLTVLTLLDFGFSPTFVRFVAYSNSVSDASSDDNAPNHFVARSRGNPQLVIQTMRVVYRRLTLVMLGVMVVGGSIAVVKPINDAGGGETLWASWLLVILGGAARFKGLQYSAFLQGAEHIALFRRWETFIGLLVTGVASLVVWLGGGLFGLILTTQAGAIITTLQNRRLAIRRSSRDVWSRPPVLDRQLMASVWPAAWRSGVGVLCTAGIVQVTGIVFAQLVPPAQSASYLLALRLVNTLRLFANVPFYTALPEMTRHYASGNMVNLIAIASGVMFKTNWFVVAGVIAVGLLADPLLTLIGSQTPFVSSTVWLLLGMYLLIERIGAMHLQLYSTTNQIAWHIAGGLSGLLVAITTPVAYSLVGIAGFPMGLLIGYAAFYTPYSLTLSYREFSLKLTDIDAKASLLPLVVLCSMFLLV